MHFILFVLTGLIAGALAGRVVSGHGCGMLGDLQPADRDYIQDRKNVGKVVLVP